MIKFIWKETQLELRREHLIAVSTISTVAVLLLLLGANLLFVLDVRLWAHRAEEEVRIAAYFELDLKRAEAVKIADTVAAWPEVKSAQFVTREERWEEFTKTYTDASQLKGVDASRLADCVRVQTKSASLVAPVRDRLEGIAGVKNVIPGSHDVPGSGHVARFISDVMHFNRIVGWAALVVALLVALVGMLVVHNTIRLALHARWREIYIMQLVGATRALISAPFLLQGMIHGALGAVLACCLLVPVHLYLGAAILHSDKPFLQLQPATALYAFAVYLVLGGALLGLLGSALSIYKVLRHRPEWQS